MTGIYAIEHPLPKINRAERRGYARYLSRKKPPRTMRVLKRNRSLAACGNCHAPFLGSVWRCQCKVQVRRYAV